MKKIIFYLFIFLSLGDLKSQHAPCLTDEHYKKQLINDPSIEDRFMEFQNGLVNKPMNRRSKTLVIPVVFHVMHNNGPENISESQILDAIDHLNIDFRRRNSDTSKTRILFKDVAADCEIEFRLATKDPKGNCTNGIVRYQSVLTENANDDIKILSSWPCDYYYNIWVVKSIASTSSLGTILGYAQFPWTGLYRTDGVIVRHDMVGTIGTAAGNNYQNRTLTHETGHWLGLFHTFQGGCGDGDYCDDTPPVKDPSFNVCFPSTQNSCNTDIPDLVDQYENYMDYSDGRCQNMFSQNQKSRMLWALDFHRRQLTTDENLVRTGVVNPLSNCGPRAQFYATTTNVCTGTAVQFKEICYQNRSNLSYRWHFENGIPEYSTDPNPVVYYHHHSVNSVSLRVSNGQVSDSVSMIGYIRASAPWIDKPNVLRESFENGYPVNWRQEGNTVSRWQMTNRSFYDGENAVMVENGFGKANQVNKIITSQYDVSGINAVIAFKYAFCQRSYNNGQSLTNDKLTFKISLDCGKTWVNKWFASGNNLNTLPKGAYLSGIDFYPPDPKNWGLASVDLNSIDAVSRRNVMFMWEFVSDAGNNVFLDDINLNQTMETNYVSSPEFKVVNPIENGKLTIESTLLYDPESLIQIYDMAGRLLFNLSSKHQSKTETWELNLPSGQYLISISSKYQKNTNKIIVQN